MIELHFSSVVITIFYLVVLYLGLSRFLFGPIIRILEERRRLIEGRLEDAQKRMGQAERKAAEYEAAIKAARTEAYRRQEAEREQALGQKAALVAQAKSEAEKAVQEARGRIVAEAAAAQDKLESEVDLLASKLAATILRD